MSNHLSMEKFNKLSENIEYHMVTSIFKISSYKDIFKWCSENNEHLWFFGSFGRGTLDNAKMILQRFPDRNAFLTVHFESEEEAILFKLRWI